MSTWLTDESEILEFIQSFGTNEVRVGFRDVEFCMDRTKLEELDKKIHDLINQYTL